MLFLLFVIGGLFISCYIRIIDPGNNYRVYYEEI
jgi:hypothetical protein